MVVIVGLSVPLAGARHTADRGRDARRQLALAQRENPLVNRDRDTLLDHQRHVGATTSSAANSEGSTTEGRLDQAMGDAKQSGAKLKRRRQTLTPLPRIPAQPIETRQPS
jgi:hypothetical protein